MKYIGLIFFLLCGVASAAEYTLTSSPRGTEQEDRKVFEPIADYLSAKTGEKFRYIYPRDWLTFRKTLAKNPYDVYFSDSHFASFLAVYRDQIYIARLKEWLSFAVVVRSGDKIGTIAQLAGRQNCLALEPNLGTLLFMSSFANPARQPAVMVSPSSESSFGGVVGKRCSGAVIPYAAFDKMNKNNEAFALHMYDLVPSQAFTASKKLPPAVLEKVRTALLDATQPQIKGLLQTYASTGFAEVDPKDYETINTILAKDYILGSEIKKPKE